MSPDVSHQACPQIPALMDSSFLSSLVKNLLILFTASRIGIHAEIPDATEFGAIHLPISGSRIIAPSIALRVLALRQYPMH